MCHMLNNSKISTKDKRRREYGYIPSKETNRYGSCLHSDNVIKKELLFCL